MHSSSDVTGSCAGTGTRPTRNSTRKSPQPSLKPSSAWVVSGDRMRIALIVRMVRLDVRLGVHHRRAVTALALAGAAPLPAVTAQPASGPDVVYSDILDVAHFGPVGDMHAYAFGTGACNIGD